MQTLGGVLLGSYEHFKPREPRSYAITMVNQTLTELLAVPSSPVGESRELPTMEREFFSPRKTRVGKAISPCQERGMLEVTLLYRNKATMLRENVRVEDFIPDGYALDHAKGNVDMTPRYGGVLVSFTVDKVLPGEQIELKYQIKATTDTSSLKNPAVKAFK